MSSRRDFLQKSASAAAAITVGPALAANQAFALSAPHAAPLADTPAKELESKLMRAHPVPLNKVRLTSGPLFVAQQSVAKYLLSLDPNRMMAYYRVQAGLPKKADGYAGWDGDKRQLTGHIAGHHLSAVSLMFLATGDARFKERADILVAELKDVQDKRGDGYIGAITTAPDKSGAMKDGRDMFADVSKGDIRSGAFDLNGIWSPWYTLHKTFAGLRDAYRYTGNKTALAVETKFAAWAESVLKPMSDAQVAKMLNTEHGGMNEVLADLYADTNDKRWLDLSYRFEHRAFTDSLKRGQDNLSGKHGNCQIPKLMGSAKRYGYTADAGDLQAASFFWDRVVQHHSYTTGGHGLAEYFGPADQLSPRVDGRTCETCNVYNMIKLTRHLFTFRPDAFYADFHERALFNHILASLDPDGARMSYMVPVGRGVQQEYQDMQTSFTCCVGSGMESHALHGDGIYYESADTLWVNLFAPSTVEFALGGVKLAQESSFPDGDSAKLTLTVPKSAEFTLAVRRPSWAGDAYAVKVNGTPVETPPLASTRPGGAGGRGFVLDTVLPEPSSYVEIKRTWKTGDVIEITAPKSLRLEATPDNKKVASVMWGPLVLAGDLGARRGGRGGGAPAPVPVLVTNDRAVTEWVQPNSARTGDFIAKQVGRVAATPNEANDVALTPFYRTQNRTYSVYFDVLTQQDFDTRAATAAAEREHQRKVEAATVAYVAVGDQTAETKFNYQSDPADRAVARVNGRGSRTGAGSMSYDLPVDGTTDMAILVTHLNDQGDIATGNYQLLVDGTEIGRFQRNANANGFFDAQYAVPANLTQGKPKVTVKFQAGTGPNGRITPVFGVRMVKAKQIQ